MFHEESARDFATSTRHSMDARDAALTSRADAPLPPAFCVGAVVTTWGVGDGAKYSPATECNENAVRVSSCADFHWQNKV